MLDYTPKEMVSRETLVINPANIRVAFNWVSVSHEGAKSKHWFISAWLY